MIQESSKSRHSFLQVFLSYSVFLVFGVLFSYVGLVLSLPELVAWREYFAELPPQVSFYSGSLYLTILMVPAVYAPIAFYPEQWSSVQSAKRRFLGLWWFLGAAVVLIAYASFMLETHLQNHFLEKGYVQCDIDSIGYMKTYGFAKEAGLCEEGAR